MIPKIIHYVWVGPKSVPDADARRIENWRKLLPDWEFRAWDNSNVDYSSRYLRMAYAVRAWNRVSDYARMDALAKFGGIYLDTDVDLLRPFDELLGCQAFLGFQIGDEMPNETVNGAVFGAERGHWLPLLIRDYFNNQLDGRQDLGSFTGPKLLTQVLHEHGLAGVSETPINVKNVTIFPRRYFYPYSWKETYSDSVITPDTFAVHRWAETWVVHEPTLKTKIRRRLIAAFARCCPEPAFLLARAVAGEGKAQ